MAVHTILDERPVVLVFHRYFSAEHDATGPTQSLRMMIDSLGDRIRFRIVSIAMPGEQQGHWGTAFGIERIAVARGLPGLLQQWRIIRSTRFDLAFHNSFFDPQLTIAVLVMRKLRLVPRRPTLVAPRGEFNRGALELKPARKRAYLRIVRLLGLDRDVHLQATDPVERATLRKVLPAAPSILIAPNIRSVEPLPGHQRRAAGEPLRVAFLSRIDPMKNLDKALGFLARSGVRARFDIIGPPFNPAYWAECGKLIATMPAGVTVTALGAVPADEVVSTLAGYDVMILPTAGENYGHVIVDSLLAGTPVLISDRTPWRGLAERRAGVDLPLEDEGAWLTWIRRFAAMTDAELGSWRSGARAYVESALNSGSAIDQVADCLASAMGKSASGSPAEAPPQ